MWNAKLQGLRNMWGEQINSPILGDICRQTFISCLFTWRTEKIPPFLLDSQGGQKPDWKRKSAMKILLHEVLERTLTLKQSQHHCFPAVTMVMRAASVSLSYGICKLGTMVLILIGVVRIRWGMQPPGQGLAHSEFNFFPNCKRLFKHKVMMTMTMVMVIREERSKCQTGKKKKGVCTEYKDSLI